MADQPAPTGEREGSSEDARSPLEGVDDGGPAPLGLRLAPHLIIVSVGYVTFGYAAVPSLVGARFGTSLVSVGLLMSAILLAFGLAQVPTGRYLDGTGTTRPLLVLSVLHAGLAVALDLVGSFEALLALRFAWGLVGGSLLTAGATHIARLYDGRAATRVQGIYGGTLTTGGAVSFLVVPAIVARTGWFGTHALGAALALPAVAALAVHARESEDTAAVAAGGGGLPDLRALVRAPTVALAAICYVAVLSSYITLSTFVTAYFRDVGVLVALNAAVLALASVGRAGGGIGAARWALDDAWTIAAATGAGAAGFLLLTVVESPLLVATLPMVTMVAVSAPFGAVYNVAGTADIGEGVGLGVVLAAGNLAALFFPAVTGLVRETTGSYAAAFGLLAALNLVALAAALRLRRR